MTVQYTPLQPETSQAQIPLLPFWATVESAYRAAWYYRAEYLKIIWCWLLLAVPVTCLYSWFVWPTLGAAFCLDFAHLQNKALIQANAHNILFAELPLTLFRLLAGASIAVAWHRLILRQEKITSPRYLRHDAVVWDYFTFGFCLWLLTSLIGFVSLLSNNITAAPSMTWSFCVLAAGIVISVVTVRLSVILPARALELRGVTFRDVWRHTSWNYWRLAWGHLLCALPGAPLLFMAKMGCGSAIAGPVMYSAAILLAIFVILPFELAFLSLCYQHFFEREKQSIPQGSGFPFKTVVAALFILTIGAVVHMAQNAGDAVNAMIEDNKKLTEQCGDDTHAEAAIQACTALINLDSANLITFTRRAAAYLKAEKYDQALDDLNHALRLKPDYFPALVMRGEIYLEKGRYSDALGDFDPALKFLDAVKANGNAAEKFRSIGATLFWQRGMAKFYAASPSAAIDDFVNAVQQDPTDGLKVIWLHLAATRAGHEIPQEFEHNSDSLLEGKWPAPLVALYRGKATVEDVFAKAKLGGDAAELADQLCDANFYTAQLYLTQNKKAEAQSLFQAARDTCQKSVEEMPAQSELKGLDDGGQQMMPVAKP